MGPRLRRLAWWLRSRRREQELREELAFHLDAEVEEQRARGLTEQEARWAAARDLGNEARLREVARANWTWHPLDELVQDLRYAIRALLKQRAVTMFAVTSLALGIGANTALYSFMDALLLRSLPVPDPASLVVLTWESKRFDLRRSRGMSEFVLHSINGSVYDNGRGGREARIFPYAAFERLQQVSVPVFSSLFLTSPGGRMNVMVQGEAELTDAQYVSGDFFAGVAVPPAAGRPILPDDDRAGAPAVAVLTSGYAQRRFGAGANAVGQPILINNVPFTVVGVTPAEFFGIDPAAAPSVYLPLHANLLLDVDGAAAYYTDPNYYWAGIIGRLRPGQTIAQAESALSTHFTQWAASTATTDGERNNLPVLRLREGAGGLDTLRRKYSKPLYLLLTMVGVILAIACANTANLLLARATTRRREMAVRLSIGAGRGRLIRQLLTESLVLACLSGVLGVLVAMAGTRLLTALLANGADGFRLEAELDWSVFAVTAALSVVCGVLFGLAPAIQSTHPDLVPALKDSRVDHSRAHRRSWLPRPRLTHALVVSQVALVMLLLMAAGLFARTLSNLQAVPLGFTPENLLLFEINAPQAGHPEATTAGFYADVQRRVSEIPGVRAVTLAHASLLKAGRGHPVTVDEAPTEGTRLLQTGPAFFSTMQIPILQGRGIDERDRAGAQPVAVISDLFARSFMPNQDPIGRRLRIAGSLPMDVEIVGVAATAHYGGLRFAVPPVVYVAYPQIPSKQLQAMTFSVRTDGDPMRAVAAVRQIVRSADPRVPVTNVRTQAEEIEQMINQEIILARLAGAFAIVALVIAGVGLYGTMAYSVTRRTREIGIRMALGARRSRVIWTVVREVCVLALLGLAISVPLARGASRFIQSFLFDLKPNDPRAIAVGLAALGVAAFLASYGPARRASRIDPMSALREE